MPRRTPQQMLDDALAKANKVAYQLITRAQFGEYDSIGGLDKLHRALRDLADRWRAIHQRGK